MRKKILLIFLLVLLLLTLLVTVACGNGDSGKVTETKNDTTITSPVADTSATTPNVTTTSTKDTVSIIPVSSNGTVISTSSPAESTHPKGTTASPTVTGTPQTTQTAGTTKPDIPEPQNGARIRVKYEINNRYAGSLEGKKTQDVYYGKTTTEAVSVTANLGYKFVGWSDGSTATVRSGECPRENTTYTAIFEFDTKELPILDLYTDSGLDITSKEVYVPGKISIHNAPEGFNFEDMTMEIRGRGNYTWGGEKKPYRIKLSEKMNLLGQGSGKARSWVLLANHCDQSLLRNQTVMQFAKMMTGIVWEPSTSSVEVFLNGNYIGVYVLTEQVQIQKNRINLSEDLTTEEIDFLLHRSGYAYNAGQIAFSYDGEPYEIVSDLSENGTLYNKQFNYIQGRIAECWDAVKGGDQDEIQALIDIDSVIDTLIVPSLLDRLIIIL